MSSLPAVRRLILLLCTAALAVGLLAPSVSADDVAEADVEDRVVDILQLSGPLTPPTMRTLRDLVADADERGAELLILEIDAPGAIAVPPEETTALLTSASTPVVVWVGPFDARAAGSATFLVTGAPLAAASRFADIGSPCPPVVDRGCDEDERALLGGLLTERGVDAGAVSVEVDGDPGDVGPAMSGEEAAAAGMVDLIAEGLEPLLVELDGREVTTADGTRELRLRQDEVTVRFHSLGLIARMLHASLDPTLVYLMLMTVLFLVVFELFQPGFGVAGVAALLVAPLAIYGLVVLPVSWWAVALILAGMALLAVDLAIAGLGVPTAAGAAALGAGSWWLYTSDHPILAVSPWLIALVVVFALVFFVWIMTVVLRAQAGPEVGEVGEELVGRVGVVRSTMNPEGHVFVSGALWRARWTGEDRGRIRTGAQVQVIGVDGSTLLVDDRGAGSHEAGPTGSAPGSSAEPTGSAPGSSE